eukprot:CAMPEP_0119281832 /NCGR_PEP_ID=MMETSP1329-20130426/25609_1 /TAXON_ID=114041 /ORGANISM="Genus nov. species nov., Strain RCC1024" /LENGTH=136 /DNA_ID=CAMNT_0007282471 /DNA_START=145 /DNA_END=552 /DNA_ORIENTATION=+
MAARLASWAASAEVRAFITSLRTQEATVDHIVTTKGAAAYASKCPTVGASVGAHLRHCLEHAQCCAAAAAALRGGESTPVLAYDARERDVALERDPAAFLEACLACREGLAEGPAELLDAEVAAAFALTADEGDGA